MKQVVEQVTGYVYPGQALYIMGASGAGKTSLRNADDITVFYTNDAVPLHAVACLVSSQCSFCPP